MRVHLPFEGGGKQAADHAREHPCSPIRPLPSVNPWMASLELGVVERLLFSTFLFFMGQVSEWFVKLSLTLFQNLSILTAEISEATFGLTPSEYARFKQLKRENLRDHMTDLELIFSMLGEAATTEIARNRDAQGFPQNKEAARAGGNVAGKARKDLETKSGRKVVTNENYLALTQATKKEQRLSAKPVKKRAKKK
ncbi:MAG: hypothetical protein IPF78_16255 [Flavobacteriales bacterium]|nr:hypothetical protein [Flavobacteriales bacterium]